MYTLQILCSRAGSASQEGCVRIAFLMCDLSHKSVQRDMSLDTVGFSTTAGSSSSIRSYVTGVCVLPMGMGIWNGTTRRDDPHRCSDAQPLSSRRSTAEANLRMVVVLRILTRHAPSLIPCRGAGTDSYRVPQLG